jgi:uncharacterized membrane protein
VRSALLLALVLVASPLRAQEPSRPAPTPDASDLLDGLLGGLLGFPERNGAELQKEVEKSGGVPFRRDVPVDFMDKAGLERFLRELFDDEYPPSRARLDERTLVAFDLLPAGTDLRAVRARLLQENIVGFYDERPGRKQLYAVSESRSFSPTNQIILAHELRHALQDQYVDLQAQVPDSVSDYDDRRLAWMCLLEGDATLVMERFVLAAGLPGLEGAEDASGFSLPGLPDVPGGAPAIVQDQLVQPYFAGRELAEAIWKKGGPATLRAAWDRPPRSTEQVLHPDKYFADERPREIPPASGPAGSTLVADGVLGEMLIRTLLEGENDAAAGWGGDAYRVFDTGAGTLLVWRSVWDRPEDAKDFEAALARRFGRRYGAPRPRGAFSEYGQERWRYAIGETAGAVTLVSADDPRALAAALSATTGASDALPPSDDTASVRRITSSLPEAETAAGFIDNSARGLDNASTETDTAGSAGEGERASPGPQGGAMASSTPGTTNLGMDPKVASLLCYVPCCIGFIFAIVAAVVEKTNRTVRFNAFQSLLLHGAGFAAMIVLSILQVVLGLVGLGAVGMLVWLVQMVLGVGLLAVLVIMLIKANSGEEYALPVVGEMARKWV